MPKMNARGVVDLGALAAAKQQQTAVEAGVATWVVDVADMAAFQDLIQRSTQHVVIVEFHSAKANAQAMSDTLISLTNQTAGGWLLARVDVDAVPDVAAALQVQSVPMVVALLGGQLAPLWQGTTDEAQMRQILAEVLRAAAENGLTKPVDPISTKEQGGPDPRFAAAEAKLDAEDYEGAREEFQKVLDQFPGDPDALAGRAQAGLLTRLRSVAGNADEVVAAGQAESATVEERLLAADVLLTVGQVDSAFALLVQTVRETAGAERDTARTRLLELFDAVGATAPEVLKARRDLAAALF